MGQTEDRLLSIHITSIHFTTKCFITSVTDKVRCIDIVMFHFVLVIVNLATWVNSYDTDNGTLWISIADPLKPYGIVYYSYQFDRSISVLREAGVFFVL